MSTDNKPDLNILKPQVTTTKKDENVSPTKFSAGESPAKAVFTPEVLEN